MAKRTSAVKMKTPGDLRDWLWQVLGGDWIVEVEESVTFRICKRERRESTEFKLLVYHSASDIYETATAATVVDLAQKFRSETYPKIKIVFERWLAGPARPALEVTKQRAIESRQPRLTQKQLALTDGSGS